MEGWKIQRDRTPCCEAFGKTTQQPGQEYFAVLELPLCVRRDLCPTCFHKLDRSGSEGHTPVFWKCRRKVPTDRGPVLDLVALRMLFDRLGGVEDERAQGLRYFVTLLLLRKRVLKMVDAMNEEQERADLVVVDPKIQGMAPVALVAPALDEDRLANLESELIEALGDADDGDDAAADHSVGESAADPSPRDAAESAAAAPESDSP